MQQDFKPKGLVPDVWVIVKVCQGTETIYRLFHGNYGGYTGSDTWNLNSGITGIEQDVDGWYHITGYSGSVYSVHRSCERMSGLMAGMYANFQQQVKQHNEQGNEPKISFEQIALDDFLKEFTPDDHL